jgi:hypothetical protein
VTEPPEPRFCAQAQLQAEMKRIENPVAVIGFGLLSPIQLEHKTRSKPNLSHSRQEKRL